MVGIDKTQTVAISKRSSTCHIERIVAQLLDRTNKFSHSLGCVRRENIWLPAMQKISGKATIERLLQIRRKRIRHPTLGGTAISIGMLGNDSIKTLTIGCNNILDITGILQTALYLKRAGTSSYQLFKML